MPIITTASTTDILAVMAGTLSGFWILIALFIGLPLGFYILMAITHGITPDVYKESYRRGVVAGEKRIGYERGYQAGQVIGITHPIDEDLDIETPD